MKLFKISIILIAIFAMYAEASTLRRRRSLDGNDEEGVGVVDDFDFDVIDSTEVVRNTDIVDNGDDEINDLKTVAIKSRVITLDRELCREQSRYHPHYPKCQMYCEHLKHWMGMCRRGDTCHCYS